METKEKNNTIPAPKRFVVFIYEIDKRVDRESLCQVSSKILDLGKDWIGSIDMYGDEITLFDACKDIAESRALSLLRKISPQVLLQGALASPQILFKIGIRQND